MDFSGVILEKTADFTGREWVFERLNTWLGNEESQHFLLTGGPGTGKSAIAARLTQILQGEVHENDYANFTGTKLVYYHFCKANDDTTIIPLRFIEALSLHLAKHYQAFAEALLDNQGPQVVINATQSTGDLEGSTAQNVVINHLHIGNIHFRTAYDLLIRKPLEEICSSEFHDRILIIVDALDEALSLDSDQNIVTLLEHTRNTPKQIRFLFTSRPDDRVLNSLGEQSLDLIEDAPRDIDDVKLYTLQRLQRYAVPDRDFLAERIAVKSEGNFLYARYLTDDLLERIDTIKDLNAIAFPAGLNDIYREFLRREIGKNLDRWEEKFSPVLGLLAVAKDEGLTRDQIVGIRNLPASKVDYVVRSCFQFLHGPKPQGPFQLYHHSFREFLLTNTEYKVYPNESHQAIAGFFLSLYGNNWYECHDPYALHNTPFHVADAIRQCAPFEPLSNNPIVKKTAEVIQYNLDTDTELENIEGFINNWIPAIPEKALDFIIEELNFEYISKRVNETDDLSKIASLFEATQGTFLKKMVEKVDLSKFNARITDNWFTIFRILGALASSTQSAAKDLLDTITVARIKEIFQDETIEWKCRIFGIIGAVDADLSHDLTQMIYAQYMESLEEVDEIPDQSDLSVVLELFSDAAEYQSEYGSHYNVMETLLNAFKDKIGEIVAWQVGYRIDMEGDRLEDYPDEEFQILVEKELADLKYYLWDLFGYWTEREIFNQSFEKFTSAK